MLRAPLAFLVAACSAGVVGASLVGLMGRWFWLFDLFSPFRLQYAALLLVACVALLVLRSWRLSAVVGVLFVLHLISLQALVVDPSQPDGTGPSLRAIQFNVLTSNVESEEAGRWLASQNADIIVAQETNQRWQVHLTELLPAMELLPSQTARNNNFGMSVFVRDGLLVSDIDVSGMADIPSDQRRQRRDRNRAARHCHRQAQRPLWPQRPHW